MTVKPGMMSLLPTRQGSMSKFSVTWQRVAVSEGKACAMESLLRNQVPAESPCVSVFVSGVATCQALRS